MGRVPAGQRCPGPLSGSAWPSAPAAACASTSGIRGTRLVASPPAECDAAMRRDGITPGPGAGSSQLADRTHLMLEVLARTPLRTWTDEFGRTAEQIIAVPSGGWAPVLFTGWSRAAMAQRDQEWMAALINRALAGGLPGTRPAPRRCASWPGGPIPRSPRPGTAAGPSRRTRRRPSVTRSAVLRFRYDMLKELEDDDSAG